jgi:nucleoside-diphosphate kinase
MNSGPVVAMVWQGKDVVKTGRSTTPLPSLFRTLTGFKLCSAQRIPLHPPLELSVVTTQLYPSPRTDSPSFPHLLLGAMLTMQDVGRNVCHGSDSVESAKKEIALWFTETELQSYESPVHSWVYE